MVGALPPSAAAGGLADTPYFSPPQANQPLPAHDRAPGITFNPHVPSHASRPSTSVARNRDRSGSGTAGQTDKKDTKEVFQDLAVQSKKGFNAFMQKLGGDKGDKEPGDSGFVMVGGGGKEDDGMGLQRRSTNRGIHGKGQETGAMRAVRAKREVDDAGELYFAPCCMGIQADRYQTRRTGTEFSTLSPSGSGGRRSRLRL